MQVFIITFASVLVGGGLAGATIVGLVDSQTKAPSKSPVDSSQVVLDYGNTN